MLAPTLAALIVGGYAAALWWWLRRDAPLVLLALLSLSMAALALRLVYTTEYPPGLTADEPKILACSDALLRSGRLASQACTGLPVLLNALFQAQLVPLLGPGRWAIRTYSLVTGVLAVPASFAVARALAMTVPSSLAVAVFMAVLPWSLLYGRLLQGGELIFHELLLVGALARLVWSVEKDVWPEIAVGGFGLCLLLYDYFCGRMMLGMPLVAALLARGRRRWPCMAVLAVALIAWGPYLLNNPPDAISGGAARLHPELSAQPLQTVRHKLGAALHTLVAPVGEDWAFAIRAGAMHPPLILALALAGVVVAPRRGVFLASGFAFGLLPAIVSTGESASVHRMLMALPFIALAAGAACDALPPRRWRTLMIVVVALLISVQSVQLFFSRAFWPPESRATFDPDATALMESLPPPPRPPVIYAQQAEDFLEMQRLVDPKLEVLTVQNWLPQHDAVIYVFADPDTAALRPFYEDVFGIERVRGFGRAFLVDLEARDWSMLRQHGWAYEVACGTAVQRFLVPTLYHAHLGVGGPPCPQPAANIWRGRWEGPATQLVLRFSGWAQVQTSSGLLAEKGGFGVSLPFEVRPDTDVTITVAATPPDPPVWWRTLLAELVEVTPTGERIPPWESVRPNPVPESSRAAESP